MSAEVKGLSTWPPRPQNISRTRFTSVWLMRTLNTSVYHATHFYENLVVGYDHFNSHCLIVFLACQINPDASRCCLTLRWRVKNASSMYFSFITKTCILHVLLSLLTGSQIWCGLKAGVYSVHETAGRLFINPANQSISGVLFLIITNLHKHTNTFLTKMWPVVRDKNGNPKMETVNEKHIYGTCCIIIT